MFMQPVLFSIQSEPIKLHKGLNSQKNKQKLTSEYSCSIQLEPQNLQKCQKMKKEEAQGHLLPHTKLPPRGCRCRHPKWASLKHTSLNIPHMISEFGDLLKSLTEGSDNTSNSSKPPQTTEVLECKLLQTRQHSWSFDYISSLNLYASNLQSLHHKASLWCRNWSLHNLVCYALILNLPLI